MEGEREREIRGGRELRGPAANNHTTLDGKATQEGGRSPVQQLGEAVFTYNTQSLL